MVNREGLYTKTALISFLSILCFIVTGCHLPSLENRTESFALDMDEVHLTELGKAIVPQANEHPGKSGVHPLPNPLDAFASRVHLIRTAEKTLDVQYYIWHADMTGTLLMKELLNAAERGVRVRLLLDDNGIRGIDAELAALNNHQNFEVRLFNPFVVRNPKWLGNISDFSRLNRRMHNKSLTADNLATIAGGRNIGDSYFGAAEEGVLYSDLNVLLTGLVVSEVSDDFDRYWTSESSYPADRILPDVEPNMLVRLTEKASEVESDSAASDYVKAISQSDFSTNLLNGNLKFEWTEVQMVSDDPAKGLGESDHEGLLTSQLQEIIGVPENKVILISAYFVPTDSGVDAFRNMTERGVNVQILTNSLSASDVTVVHAGYSKYRKDLLQAGVQLYEIRLPTAGIEQNLGTGPLGSAATSLYAKTFSVDSKRVFVGSFNFDPRSVNLNTELGFVINSPSLASQIAHLFEERIPENAYEVRLNENDSLYWIEQKDGRLIHHETEPESSIWMRIWIWLLSILPIEWLL